MHVYGKKSSFSIIFSFQKLGTTWWKSVGVFSQWSILHLVILAVQMHLLGFSLVLCWCVLPLQSQSPFLAWFLILLGYELPHQGSCQ